MPRISEPIPSELIAAAAAIEGGTAADVLGPDRRRHASRSRHAAMWLAFKIAPHSLSALGRAFGRHHSTVVYGIRAYERRLAEDAGARLRGDALLTRFLADETPIIETTRPEENRMDIQS
jgi:chromosomal replication initiation ATPase DnaA